MYSSLASFGSFEGVVHKEIGLGVVKNIYPKFHALRKRYQEIELTNSKNDSGILENKKNISLLDSSGTARSSKDFLPNELELSSVSASNKKYIELYLETNTLYEEMKQNFANLQAEEQKRIVPKFDESENKIIDRKIKEYIIETTSKVKKCEANIKKLALITLPTSAEENVKNNMKANLAEKIKDFTHIFRLNEEKYMQNYKELVGDTENIEVEQLDKNDYERVNSNIKNDFLQITDYSLKRRDEEITTLLTSITELAATFRDLQTLVQEQGTILDRIDYNIENALDNTKSAKKALKKANENMKQNCFRNATMVLLIIIFILSVLLLLKFT